MSELSRALRFITYLYLGGVSMTACGYGLDASGSGGNGPLIEIAWSCAPVFHPEKISNWQVGSKHIHQNQQWEFTDEFKAQLYSALLEFRGCSDQAISDQLRKYQVSSNKVREMFVNAYVTFDYGYSNIFGVVNILHNSPLSELNMIPSEMDRRGEDIVILQANVSSLFATDQEKQKAVMLEREKQREEEQAKLAVEAAAKEESKRKSELEQQARMDRAKALKSGTAKVATMSDAVLLTEPVSLLPLMDNPLLTPDGKYYSGDVLVEAQESSLIRVQGVMLMGQFGDHATHSYAYLKLPKKPVNFSAEGMRIGGTITIVGKYVSNINYRTVRGEVKTAPVIECAYYATAENNNDRAMKLIKQQLGQ